MKSKKFDNKEQFFSICQRKMFLICIWPLIMCQMSSFGSTYLQFPKITLLIFISVDALKDLVTMHFYLDLLRITFWPLTSAHFAHKGLVSWTADQLESLSTPEEVVLSQFSKIPFIWHALQLPKAHWQKMCR